MTNTFTQYRAYVFSIAYRMLGSVMDAEDMVQETFLQWRKVDQAEVESPKSYLATIVTRLCIDHLRSARVQRETYVGPWLPEPLVTETGPSAEGMTALSDSLSTAFLVLLERLTPTERAAFLLREVFAYDYAEVANIINKSEANSRQIVRRARQHIQDRRPRFDPSPSDQTELLQEFMQACTNGDMSGLMALLAEDVVEYSDGGGKVYAALKPIYGAEKVARFLFALTRQAPAESSAEVGQVNGQPALFLYVAGQLFGVMTMDVVDGRIQNIYSVVNPDKLRHLSS
jgi:RNA polymerase sigma-70 factor (ECF subfamily)